MSTTDTLEGRTIVVTGGTGFIGNHLLRRLRELKTARLIAVSRQPPHASTPRETWITSDCQHLTPDLWRSAGVEQVDCVFHLAAVTAKGGAPPAADRFEANVDGTVALIRSLPSTPQRTIVASTLDVYAPVGPDDVLSESSPVQPQGPYAQSKLRSEEAAQRCAAERGGPCVVLRYGHIFGPGEQAYRKLIPEAIRRLLAGQAPLVYGDGSTLRDYLYVEDAVEATIRAAVVLPAPSGPINVVRGESCSVRDVIETLRRVTECPHTTEYLLDRAGGMSLRFDAARMRATLGEWRNVSLEEGLRREVADFLINDKSS